MINYEKSAELNNCTIEELKIRFEKFPNSNKLIIRVCDNCHKELKIKFQSYSDLCNLCSKRTPEAREAARLKSLEQFSTQEARDITSKAIKQFHIDNPDAGAENSKRQIQWHKDHPEAAEEQSKKVIKYYENPDNIKAAAKRTTEYFLMHPEAGEAASLRWSEYWSDPEHRKDDSERQIAYLKEHPEKVDIFITRMKKYWSDQGNCDLQSDRISNSGAMKIAIEKMVGGNDIIKHHFIYDHNNPDQHTVEITRSQHTSHHNWMRRNGLKVPHINVTEDNKDMFGRYND
jgi:hypothetical protein